MMRIQTGLAAALLVAIPTLSSAWYGGQGPGYYPPGYGYGPQAPYPWSGGPPASTGTESGSAPGAAPAESGSHPGTQGGAPETGGAPVPFGPWGGEPRAGGPWGALAPLRIQREAGPDSYTVRIASPDGKTTDIQATPAGRGLAISRIESAQTQEEKRFDDGRGYMQSYSFSQGSSSRFVTLPRDADLGHMTREDKDGVVALRIPRISYGGRPPVEGQAPTPKAP
jgi:hypothetical protein